MEKKSRFRFERMEIWIRAIEFAGQIYRVSTHFPTEERYGLTSQIRRASVSISSNVAEGSSRTSDIDFARFIEIAYGSLMECVSQLYIAKNENWISDDDFHVLYQSAEELGRMLSGFRGTLKR